MKKTLLASSLLLASVAYAAPKAQWVTVDSNILGKLAPMQKALMVEKEAGGVSLVQLTESELEKLSNAIHNELHRCGGYIAHESEAEALLALEPRGDMHYAMKGLFADYDIDQEQLVVPMVAEVKAANIEATIRALSAFHNRYYKATTGSDSQNFLLETWSKLAAGRSDVKVELVKHANWPQPSVVMTIEGSDTPEEILIIGGHADSIAGGWFGNEKSRAPGGDDNASGIASITETIRIAMAAGFKPRRTVQFMGYAAEEAGLLGSKDIANGYRTRAKSVVGVIQFDMTLRKGTVDKDIVMMTDFTNAAQNEFLGKLIDEYVKVPWGYSKCGYGCSDHASWTNAGFPASMPFESTMGDINKAIHTDKDTIENAGGNANHAAKFAKLAVAFMVELAN
jgi:leucyl aminopeptidase